MGSESIHPALRWLWKSSCQQKHKVFFWLLIRNRLNTKGLLRRKNIELQSYNYELCIIQREATLRHLFLKCNFARRYWNTIGINFLSTYNLSKLSRVSKGNLKSLCTWK
ncbi:hypothetical protein PR202_gb26749 [Eleusine coracana subsp. coracana]|uniref:Reverse transcriptase zinc-binding domain-containing protein n=1 Tax=Eleusine coracana subsp. coracana TaxID=191504 RepID=A0AAV5FSJ6_ELECO|nr:hypothetical protein PR202_gb26749 [Eleusine coracana subsp. coracana]